MRIVKFILFFLLILEADVYSKETINKSLASAYLNNSRLNSEREKAKSVDENLIQALSAFKPTITISGSKSDTQNTNVTTTSGVSSSSSNLQTSSKSIKVEQKVLNFNDMYTYQKQKNAVEVARYSLKKVEQEVLLEAADAFTGVLLSQKKLLISKDNLSLSEKQVEVDKGRLEKGLITITDLAQSESSLAAAQSNFLNAENELLINTINFKNVIGYDPKNLEEISNVNFSIPKSLQDTIDLAQKNNATLKISEFSLKKAQEDYKSAVAELGPSFKLSYGITDYDDYSSSYDKTKQSVAKAEVSIPLYQGGKQNSVINEKKANLEGAQLDLQSTKNLIDKESYAVWSNYRLALSNFELSKARLKASEIAYEGIVQEYETGTRTTLDVITSRASLLDSRLSNANSEKERILSQYKLLLVTGSLTAKDLSLEAKIYDPDSYLGNSWIRHIF